MNFLVAALLAAGLISPVLAFAKSDGEKCEDRAKTFRSDLKENENIKEKIKYRMPRSIDKSPRLYDHECKALEVSCKKLQYNVDLTTQRIHVIDNGNEIPLGDAKNADIQARTASGRLMGINFTNPKRASEYAYTPLVKKKIIKASKAEAYRCSGAVVGAGMPFAIPIGIPGYYIHGLDGNEKKTWILGTPASAGCIRVPDSTACMLYATLQKCGKVEINVNGDWEQEQVYNSQLKLVPKETEEEGLARAERDRQETLRRIEEQKAQAEAAAAAAAAAPRKPATD